ncbi:cyclodeaminase/cyclohydrolase family protein [Limibacillus sp. MBR-115]|jgi:formiminotetrahydrofolate cyclodeaminase|uniref:cyclodeaminase/cyclohydrolase family protein n=1 Tax=Limibacillus sp. MBR-115 TaxID=3156465 RepID=UPI0033984C97
MLVKHTVEEFSKVLASDAPAPGGGSVAALSGALGADLVTMVCNLSIGRENFEAHSDELKRSLAKAQALSASLLQRVDLDTEAFTGVMKAFKMPKATDEEKLARSAAIQAGYQDAIQSPLGIARECVAVLELAEGLLGRSNPNALSDLGVAAQQAYAGLEGAIMNVRINIPSIKDAAFVQVASSEVEELLGKGSAISERVHGYVTANIG